MRADAAIVIPGQSLAPRAIGGRMRRLIEVAERALELEAVPHQSAACGAAEL